MEPDPERRTFAFTNMCNGVAAFSPIVKWCFDLTVSKLQRNAILCVPTFIAHLEEVSRFYKELWDTLLEAGDTWRCGFQKLFCRNGMLLLHVLFIAFGVLFTTPCLAVWHISTTSRIDLRGCIYTRLTSAKLL